MVIKKLMVPAAIVGGILIVFGGLRRKLFSFISPTTDSRTKEAVENIEVNESNLSVDKSRISGIADEIEQYMIGMGTDTTSLFNAIKELNPDELRLLYKYFGVRKNNFWVFLDKTGDLISWFKWELDDSDLRKMRLIWEDTNLWK